MKQTTTAVIGGLSNNIYDRESSTPIYARKHSFSSHPLSSFGLAGVALFQLDPGEDLCRRMTYNEQQGQIRAKRESTETAPRARIESVTTETHLTPANPTAALTKPAKMLRRTAPNKKPLSQ